MEDKTELKIKEQIIALLHNKYSISMATLNPEQWDIPLTSKEISLTGFELAYLFFEIEKIYGKNFEENVLRDYGFCSINSSAKAIHHT